MNAPAAIDPIVDDEEDDGSAALVVASDAGGLVPLGLVDSARGYAADARAAATRQKYREQWERFDQWCDAHGFCALPTSATALSLYLSACADDGLSVATLGQALAAIAEVHKRSGHPSPRTLPKVREVWKGIRRRLGTAPRRRVAPVIVDELRQLAEVLDETRIGRRDRALLTIGFAAALRRSELVALDVEDLRFTADGLEILVRKSKTDQEGEGALVGVPFGSDLATCPVRSLRTWLADVALEEGAVFRAVSRHGRLGERLSDRDVARIVKRTALRAGLDPAPYAGHSLRAGLATSAAKAGKRDRAIMKQGRWRSRAMVDRYVRDATLIDDDNAAAGIGL